MAKPGAMLKSLLILPFNVLVTVPGVILWIFGFDRWEGSAATAAVAIGALVLIGATYGMARTSMLFLTQGQGTPAPWDPPKKLVVEGPYRHVRNPLISSVVLGLTGEGLVFNSVPLIIWTGVFLTLNFVYMKFSEEPGLVKRFGGDYEEYRRNVPAWIPRLQPWARPVKREQAQASSAGEQGSTHKEESE